jgi:TRAP-type mannitol/chloroaromatic compound transport system substrate-binding protein
MKKNSFCKYFFILGLVVLVAAASLSFLGCSQKAGGSETAQTKKDLIRWRLQTYAGPSMTDDIVGYQIKEFNKIAEGEMVIDIYSADQLVPHGELFNAVQSGTIDLALSDDESMGSPADVAIFSAYFPAAGRIGLDIDVLWERYGLNEIWKEAYDEIDGVTWLSQGSWDPCLVASNKPIRSIEDLKGLRLFTSLFNGKFLEAEYGVVPIVMPVEDVQMALQTGMLDGVTWSGVTELYTTGVADVCDYLLTNPISGAWSGGFFANTKSWEALPEHLQRLLHMTIDSSNYYRLVWYWWGEAQYRAEGTKMELTSIPESQWTGLEVQAAKYWDEFSKKSPRAARVVEAFKKYAAVRQEAGAPYSSGD